MEVLYMEWIGQEKIPFSELSREKSKVDRNRKTAIKNFFFIIRSPFILRGSAVEELQRIADFPFGKTRRIIALIICGRN